MQLISTGLHDKRPPLLFRLVLNRDKNKKI